MYELDTVSEHFSNKIFGMSRLGKRPNLGCSWGHDTQVTSVCHGRGPIFGLNADVSDLSTTLLYALCYHVEIRPRTTINGPIDPEIHPFE